jgi:serine/threonine-protein kinase RsbT
MAPQQQKTTIQSDLDIVTARSNARDVAKKLGFGGIDQARIATAVSELSRNIYLYAGHGHVIIRSVEKSGRQGIEFEFQDEGPGIENIEQVMQDGYSTSRGMGMGLPGAKRLMDDFDLQTTLGKGTKIICRKWRR